MLDSPSGVEQERLRRFQMSHEGIFSRGRVVVNAMKENTVAEVNRETMVQDVAEREDDMSEEEAANFKKVSFTGSGPPLLQYRVVHLDLKGAAPRLQFLARLLAVLKRAGASHLLLEYEDMFPYQEKLSGIPARTAYERTELLEFLELSDSLGLEVIPLVQTFGHLEYVLKLQEYQLLREREQHPDSICPSNTTTLSLIQEMITQVVDFHSQVRPVRWFHVGADEVYHINLCELCQARNLTSKQIFIDHVSKVATIVRNLGATPLIWDDMLRGMTPAELEALATQAIIPVVWVYQRSIMSLVPHKAWYMYTKTFPNIWIASAFKGASGSTKLIPDLNKNYENHLAWLYFIKDYKMPGTGNKYHFQGIVLTGWSRYHHFSVLCEMLPVSLPSLLLNLVLIEVFLQPNELPRSAADIDTDVYDIWLKFLKCPKRKEFRLGVQSSRKHSYLMQVEEFINYCDFPGNRLYDDIKNLIVIEKNAIRYHINYLYKTNGLLEFNTKYKMVNLFQNIDAIEKAKRLDNDLNVLSQYLQRHMAEFFDNSTILEFIEYKVTPIKSIARRVIESAAIAEKNRVWKNRPYVDNLAPVDDSRKIIADGG